MTEKQLFLVIAIVCLVLFIVYKIIYRSIEGFDTPAPTNTTTLAPTDTPTLAPTDTPTFNQNLTDVCPTMPPKPWWETEPPKQIVSYVTGVRFPVHAIKPSDAINSPFQVPYIKSGETESSGCIVIENAGTFTTRMCNADSIEQRWKIQKINDEKQYVSLLANGSQYYSSGSMSTVTLPQGVQYGFFLVTSEKDPSMVLASNGGNLTVQRIGNYTSQFWDITRDIGNANISIYDIPPETALSQNFTDPRTIGAAAGAGSVYQYPGVSGNNTSTSGFGVSGGVGTGSGTGNSSTSRNRNGPTPYNINVNFDSQSLMKLFGDVSTTGPGLSGETSATSSPPEGFNPNPGSNSSCPACPSILTDYISKKDIPCLGCKL